MANENMVRAWGSNVRNAEYGFFKAITWAIEQFQHKNNAPIGELKALVYGKPVKGFSTIEGEKLKRFAPAFDLIVKQTLADTTITFDTEARAVKVKVGKQGGVNGDKLRALQMLTTIPRITVNSDAFKSAFPKVVKEQPTLDADAVAKKACEKARKALERISKETGVSLDVLRHALDAKPTNEVAH